MSGGTSADAGAVSQHNSGGINVANTGTIERLVVNAGTRPLEEPLWMVPPLPGPVVQRPELAAALRSALLSTVEGPVAVTTALEGAGGFGKTTLAADLCLTDRRVHERFGGGLLWVTLGQNAAGAELAAKVNGVCELLTGHASTVPEPEQAGFRLGALLGQRPDTLLVIDDVWNSAQLAPFLIGAPRCRRLITTRNATILPRGGTSIPVDAMESGEAIQTLTQGLPDLPQPMVERLVALTGRWPVLLSLVNAAMVEYARQGATVAQAGAWVAERLEAVGPTALDVGDAPSRDRAVEATVRASMNLMSPQEQERYLDLAIFPEDVGVPGSVLALLWFGTGGVSRAAADRLVSRLASLRLASGTWQDGPALKLHDVLRSYLRHEQGIARLAELNRALLDAARSTVLPRSGAARSDGTAWWLLPDDADYLWRHLSYHLAEAGAQTELTDLVCDLRWLLARIERYGPVETGSDLALSSAPTANELRRIVGRQAHLLGRLQPGLADTLLSRIPVTRLTEEFRSRANRVLTGPRLTPLWPLPDLPDPDLDRTLEGHAGALRACAASPDGRWLASAGFDRSIRIWDVATGSTYRVLHGHTGWVWDCAWTSDSKRLVSASDDGTVRVWDPTSGYCSAELTGHDGAVLSCTVSPDGTWLASGGVDGTIRIWDLPSEHCRSVLAGHENAVTCCDVAPDGTWMASSGYDGTVRIWDVHSGTQRASLAGHVGWVNACAIGHDGTLLVSAGADRTVRLWEPATGQLGITLVGGTSSANACTIARDGGWIAAGGSDSMVRVWRPRWGESADNILRSAAATRTHAPRVPAEPVRECVPFPGGNRVVSVSTDGIVRLWDTATGTELAARHAHTGVAQCCTVAPDGSWFATGGYDGVVQVWEPDGQAPRLTLVGHTGWVMRCAVTPDGAMLASVSYDGTIRLWDAADGASIAVLSGNFGQQYGCAFSGDGVWLASTGSDRSVRLWDVASRTPVATLAGHTARINNCEFAAGGGWLASAGFDGTIRTWDLATGTPLLVMDSGAQWGCSIAISPDDAWIASASSDGVVRIWDARTGSCRNALRVETRVRACSWMSDTRLCVAGDAGIYVLEYVWTPT